MSTETTTPVDKEFLEYLRRLGEVATTIFTTSTRLEDR